MSKLFRRFARNESGATAIEYGLIAAFISVALVAALPTIKTNLTAKFGQISTALGTANN